jgi:hypothetical protein
VLHEGHIAVLVHASILHLSAKLSNSLKTPRSGQPRRAARSLQAKTCCLSPGSSPGLLAAGDVGRQGNEPHGGNTHGSISLLDTGTTAPASAEGKSLWIRGTMTSSRYAEANILAGIVAAAQTIPADTGYMMLFHRLPSGDLQSQYMGYVYRGHQYTLLFSSDYAGTHEILCKVGWKDSNHIRFHVLGDLSFDLPSREPC